MYVNRAVGGWSENGKIHSERFSSATISPSVGDVLGGASPSWKAQMMRFSGCRKSSSGPKTCRLTEERRPSAPTTRSNVSSEDSPVAVSRSRTLASSALVPMVSGTVEKRTGMPCSSKPLHRASSMSPRRTTSGWLGWSVKLMPARRRLRWLISHVVLSSGVCVFRASITPR